jgi:hypothetical protein
VAVLQAPNPTAPGGVTSVYLLGMSHVSQVRPAQPSPAQPSPAPRRPAQPRALPPGCRHNSLPAQPQLRHPQPAEAPPQPGAPACAALPQHPLPAARPSARSCPAARPPPPPQASCDQIRELIKLVRPEVVMVEVCKDRLALLVDAESKAKDTWICRRVRGLALALGRRAAAGLGWAGLGWAGLGC